MCISEHAENKEWLCMKSAPLHLGICYCYQCPHDRKFNYLPKLKLHIAIMFAGRGTAYEQEYYSMRKISHHCKSKKHVVAGFGVVGYPLVCKYMSARLYKHVLSNILLPMYQYLDLENLLP